MKYKKVYKNTSNKYKLKLNIQFAISSKFLNHKYILSSYKISTWIRASLFSNAIITIRFVEINESLILNKKYLLKDNPTNILTFSYNNKKDKIVESDLILCSQIIEKESIIQNKNLIEHYAHLIIHGTLHAQGYDHLNEKTAKKMEKIESNVMKSFGFLDPYVF